MPFDGGEAERRIEALQKLEAVRTLIGTPEKWCKFKFRDSGARCLRAAITDAGALRLHQPVLAAIEEVTGSRWLTIELFNDHARTRHATVMRVLDIARRRLAGEPAPPSSLWRRLRARLQW